MPDYTEVEKQRRLIEEIAKRKGRLQKLDWDALMFGKQRDFIRDTARLKVACCSRRAGKSHGSALALLEAGFKYPGSFPIYMNANRASAKIILWPALMELDDKLKLGLNFNQTTGDVGLPNGTVIKVFGVGTRREMDKARGGKPPLVVIDEAQNMGSDLAYLISQILLPATMDYKAPILVTGTPNASCSGPFHDIVHGGTLTGDTREGLRWSVHWWTAEDNPHIKDIEEEYELAIAANPGWTLQHPAFLREYRGKWVRDTQGLAYTLNDSMLVNAFPQEATTDWRYILGVDLGTVDPCAFTVLASSRAMGMTYILESWRDEYTTLQAGTEIERLREIYPFAGPHVVDSGGQGAAFVRQWKDTHPTLPIEPVKKGFNSVDMGINIINADAIAGKIKIVRNGCTQLIDEMQTLVWDEKTSPTGARRIKRGDIYQDHCTDSLRYAYTKVRTWSTKGWVYDDTVAPGSSEWFKREAARHKRLILNEKVQVTKPQPYWQKIVRPR
jgi:hypothetical protein